MPTIHAATEKGNVREILDWLEHGSDVNELNARGETPLIIAARVGKLKPVETLIAKGANVNTTAVRCYSPYVNKPPKGDKRWRSPLQEAAINGNADVIKFLVAKGADIEGPDVNYGNATPLHLAARFGRVSAIRALIAKGADVNAVNDCGHTPLRMAVEKNQLEGIRVLLSLGATADKADRDGGTPLCIARGDAAVTLLVTKGACLDGCGGRVPLTCAVERNSMETVVSLLRLGANVNAVDCYGNSPIHFVNSFGEFTESNEILFALLRAGANLNASNRDGKSVIHITAGRDSCTVMEVLADLGADVDAADEKEGRTSLHFAAKSCQCIEVLAAEGANICAVDTAGNTPLHLAVQNAGFAAIQALLAKGSNINLQNNEGRTPLDLVEMIVSHRRDVIKSVLSNDQ